MTWRREKKEKYLRVCQNKKLLAPLLGISRKKIYHKSIQEEKDLAVKKDIEDLHLANPAYGHKRVALALGMGHNRAKRVMKKYGIKPPRRKGKPFWLTRSTNHHTYTNLIKNMIVTQPGEVFVSDLTYLKFQGRKLYLATVEDIFTREIVSARVSDRHDSALALSAIEEALEAQQPQIFHSDQGSEFMATSVTGFLEKQGVKISVSAKASPWENGYKESFFGRFKDEAGDLNRFETTGELVEEIYSYVAYYNSLRIHTALKMPPVRFRKKFLDSVSQKLGT